MAQRLIRLLCPKCKVTYTPTLAELTAIGLKEKDIAEHTIYKAVGCPECKEGYKSRQGIYELMEMDPKLRELTFNRASTAELQTQAKKSGMVSLLEDGIRKVLAGVTTIEEILLLTRREDIQYNK